VVTEGEQLFDCRQQIADFGPVFAGFSGDKKCVTKKATSVSDKLWLVRPNWQLAIENWKYKNVDSNN
jgi:hypothetical protein